MNVCQQKILSIPLYRPLIPPVQIQFDDIELVQVLVKAGLLTEFHLAEDLPCVAAL